MTVSSRTARARRTVIGALAMSALLALTACASGGGAGDGHTLKDSGKQLDTVTVALPGSLSNLYPGQESGILNYYVASISQEGLVGLDAKGKVVPALAKTWSQPDPTTYVYNLRDDAKFQNGDPVTADDVVFSIEKAQDATLSPGVAGYLSGVTSVEKTGAEQVTVKLSAPNQSFNTLLSTAGALFVTEKSFWEKNDGKIGTSTALTLGTGPYKVTEFQPDSHVTFERVDTWWGGVPKAKKIVIDFVPDDNTRLLSAKKGDVDVAFNVPLAQSKQWEALNNMRVDYFNDLSYVGLLFDTRVAPFDDPKVREAIAYAVDKKSTVDSLLRGHGEVATSLMTPESLRSAYSISQAKAKLATIPQRAFSITKAKAALAASTHPKGFTAEITYPATGPQLGTAAQALAQNLAQIGITLKVKELPIEQWLATIGDGSHGINFMWYFSTTGDPAEVPSYLLGEGNPSGYDNAKVTELLAQAAAESDPATRIDLLVKADTQQADDAINIPLWWGQSAIAFSDTVGIPSVTPFTFLSSWPAALYRAQ